MSDNLSVLSSSATQCPTPLFAFDKKSFFLTRRKGDNPTFRKRKRKSLISDTIITRIGKVPVKRYASYHFHMSCLEVLREHCNALSYDDLLSQINNIQADFYIYLVDYSAENYAEEYEKLHEKVLGTIMDCDARGNLIKAKGWY